MPNWIGDLVLGLAVALRKRKAEAHGSRDFSLIVPERLCGLARLLCDLPVIPLRRRPAAARWESVRSVREQLFAKLYLLPHSFSSALFGFFTRIPVRRGVAMELRSLLLTERIAPFVASRDRHLTHEYAKVLETEAVDPALWKGTGLQSPVKLSADWTGAIVLCPGAVYGPAKQWPHFDELVRLLPEYRFVIAGDGKDRSEAARIASLAPSRIVTLAGETTLEEAAAIIAEASLVVSNDSGLLHVAGFLGTPCIGIYGSTSSTWTRPVGGSVRIAHGSCPRAPCFRRVCPEKHYHCLGSIAPETVAAMARELLFS